MTSVSIFCANPVLCRGLQCVVSDDFLLLGISSSISELTQDLQNRPPDLLVVETTPSMNPGFLRELGPVLRQTAVIVRVDSVYPDFVSQCLLLGVRGVLSKTCSVKTHLRCLKEVAAGNLWVDQQLSRSLADRQEIHLTPRERQLMGLLAQGLKNKQMAWSLGITEGTVKVYLSKLFTKMGATDRFSLALVALKNLSPSVEQPECGARRHGAAPVPLIFPATIRRALRVVPFPAALNKTLPQNPELQLC